MSELKMNIERKYRLCTVNDEPGYFHAWEQWSNVVDASPLMGGHPGGQISEIFGIVEFKDGVRRIKPNNIKFCDEDNVILCELVKHFEELKKEDKSDAKDCKL